MKLNTLFSTFTLASLLAFPALSSPLNDYNLILTGNYNYGGGEVQGAAFVGGNLNASGKAPTFSTRAFSNPVGLTVVGDMYASNINMNSGKNIVFGGTNKVANKVNMNGGGVLTSDEGLSVAGLQQQLAQESHHYANLAANGDFSKGILKYAGDSDVAVFNLAASLLFAQNTNLSLDFGNATSVIINVSGKDVAIAGGVNLNGNGFNNLGAANILWNFTEATAIDFNGIGMIGAVLAIDADTRGGSSFKGSFAAHSYTGARAFEWTGFNPLLPKAGNDVVVTEPALSLMFITGVLGVAVLHRRRKQRGNSNGQLTLAGK